MTPVLSDSVAVTIPGYENFRPIGSGGFSTVYEARQPELNRRVAVKVLTLGADQDFDRAAFEGECRAMGTVSEHPNIVTVYESGFSREGLPYITMELYNETLLDKIKARRFLPLEEVLSTGVLMAGALHRAHEERLLHRDIKPQNIFFSQYGEPFLGDFGIAALAHEQHAQRSFGLTFHYAAPEVIDGEMPQIESDIYSLGATLYTAIAGHRPFARPGVKEGEAAIANRILSEPPPPIGSQAIPDNVERSLLTLLAKHPNDRPRTALALGKLLREIQGRLGHQLTPMRVAAGDFDDDHTVAREIITTTTPSFERPGPAPVEPVTAGDSFEDSMSGSVTVYKSANKDQKTDAGRAPKQSNRPLLGAIAVTAILLIGGGLGFLLLSGPDDSLPETSSTDTATTTTTTVFIDSSPPEKVALVDFISGDGDTVTATWDASERATQYRVDFTTGGLGSELTTEPQFLIDTTDVDFPLCLSVVAAGEGGRTASPSDTFCFGG